MTSIKGAARKTSAVLVVVNLALAGVKTAAWLYTGSLALQTEAFNSYIDTIYATVIFGGVVLSTRDPSNEYPEGYRRLEPLLSLVVAGGVITTAVLLGEKAITGLQTPGAPLQNAGVGLTVLALGSFVKFWLYKYSFNKGRELGNPTIVAESIDNRNDIFTAIVAFSGVLGVTIGVGWLDAAAALVVAIMIGYSGLDIIRENIGYMLGRAPSQEERDTIKDAALSHDDVFGVHDTEIHHSGPLVDISLHLEIEGGMTVEEAHQVEVEVADNIRDATETQVNEINLHIDPKSLDEWKNDPLHQ